jgi:hypothetical protein
MNCSTVSDNQIILLGISTVKLTINAPFSLTKATNTSGLSVDITLPSSSFTAGSTGCTTNGSCSYVSASNGYHITSLTNSSFPLTVTFTAQTTYFSVSSSLQVSISYQSQLISTNSNTTVTAYCTSPCQQCTVSPAACSSCLPQVYTPNATLYRPNNTCVQLCPDGFYNSNITMACELCNNNCSKCNNTADNCSACALGSNTYLYNNLCTDTCPSNYYKNTTLLTCMICPVGCLTCINSTYCQTCQALYLLQTGTCVSTCVNSSFIPLNGICTPCILSCQTCLGTTNNCTTCNSSLILYNNSCLAQCPSHTYINAGSCYSCQ